MLVACPWNRCLCGLFLVSSWAMLLSTGAADEPQNFTNQERQHWAFQPVAHPPIPIDALATRRSAQNPIDSFVSAGLQKLSGTTLTLPTDRLTLLRRVTFDLIGLPPTPAEADEFLADATPDAVERLVDRLLANPHYGETWARMWLDVVRFAETAGFNADPTRPLAYKYRDYVIRAFNHDVVYDRFLQEQLAGDELFPDDVEAQAATGYCRMWADESNASNIHLARQLALNDLTGNLGAAVLGLSIGCAQCHDHKFDPLLQTDFYQLQAFFSGIVLEDQVPIGSRDELAKYHRQHQQWLADTANLRHDLQAVEREARVQYAGAKRMKFPSDVLAAIDCLPEERTTLQRQLAFWSERQMDFKNEELVKHLTEEDRVHREYLVKRLAEARDKGPKPPREAKLMAVAEMTHTPPPTYRLANGSYDQPREEVPPHYPAILRTSETLAPPRFTPPNERSPGRRAELARWLTRTDHPLTFRVWVNRIWQGHFGRGLVENANDFGLLTPRPSHLELFDWLTSEYVATGFSTKRLHRLVVLSATYQQQGHASAAGGTTDLSFFPRHRLTSERIRDAGLAAAGTLNDTMYGPGVRPELPPNFGGAGNWKVSDPPDRVRRSVYIFAKRNLPYPLLAAFDQPDMHESCGCRTTTTIAPQALTLLNSELILQSARQLAERASVTAPSAEPTSRIVQAWRLALGRRPSVRETQSALDFLTQQRRVIALADVARTGEDADRVKDGDDQEAFVDFCHALLNANEFLFVE